MYFVCYLHIIKLTYKNIHIFSILCKNEKRGFGFLGAVEGGTSIFGGPVKYQLLNQHKKETANAAQDRHRSSISPQSGCINTQGMRTVQQNLEK